MTFFSLTNSSSAVHFLIVIPLLPSMLPQQSNGSFPMFPYPNTYFDILFILSIGIYGNVWYSAAKNVILHLIKMSMELKEHFNSKIFALISETADELGLECYVVGGYVRDIFLNRPSKDIDVVVVGSGIEIAQAFGKNWDVVRMSLFSRISEQHK